MAKKEKKATRGKDEPVSDWPVISVAAHPRAARTIRRSKAWAGLLAFALVGALSWRAGVEPFEAGVRALTAGIGLYLVTWMAGVALWRSLVVEEARQEGERRRAAIEEQLRLAREKAETEAGGTNGGEAAA
jgi:hypothetical protein